MKLLWVCANPKKVLNAKGQQRWEVRWRLDPGHGRPLMGPRDSSFLTAADAKAFITRLHDAEYGRNGWCFDERGRPTQASAAAPTVFAAVCEYVDSRWNTVWQESQRRKARTQLAHLIIQTVTRPTDRAAMAAAFEAQRTDRGRRREPSTQIEWAGRWLRDHGLLPGCDGESLDDERLVAGRAWLQRNSLSVAALGPKEAARLRDHFSRAGLEENSRRTYWDGVIDPFITWLHVTDKIDKNPTAGLPKRKRDVESERPYREDIPDPEELFVLARRFGHKYGELWELWVLMFGFCALRISQTWAIRGTSFERDASGRLWVRVNTQVPRSTKKTSDDGATSRKEKKNKGRRDSTPKRRRVPIPDQIAARLVAHLGERLGTDPSYLFVGPRGTAAPEATVRRWWAETVRDVFGDNPRLSGLTPHYLRHAGMTYWYAAKRDHKEIQQWGGWESLQVMNDTYRHVIRSLEDEQLAGLDEFYARWLPTADDDEAVNDAGAVEASAVEPVPNGSGDADEMARPTDDADRPAEPLGMAGVIDLAAARAARRRNAKAS